MTETQGIDARIAAWMEEREAGTRYPDRLLSATFDRTRSLRQAGSPVRVPLRYRAWRPPAVLGATVVLVATVGALGLGIGAPVRSPEPSVSATPNAKPSAPRIHPREGIVLGWSADQTRVLVQKDNQNLFIVHEDGSETQLTDQLTGFDQIPGSSRPNGATISPDGEHVVFAGLAVPWREGRSCHDGALFGLDVETRDVTLLFSSQAHNGIVRLPTYSPDGSLVAFADGYCDYDHSVWVMNPDGSDQRQIVPADALPGAGHVAGLAWAPASDRLALRFEGRVFTFAPDGSGMMEGGDVSWYCWPGEVC